MELMKIQTFSGKIVLKTGLHIGCGDMEMKIGGTDQEVIKHPHTSDPYIPGSSLKGKVRALLEMRSGLMAHSKGKPLSDNVIQNCQDNKQRTMGERIIRLFGTSGSTDEENEKYGPTRVSFGDCMINTEWKAIATSNHWPMTEVKSENSINRIKGTAEHPRFIERIPSGVKFDFSIRLKQFKGDTSFQLDHLLLEGLKLLSHDSLGGNGSRGYGQVFFEFSDKEYQDLFNKMKVS